MKRAMTTMTDCAHRYEDATDGLACTREDGHADGHSYVSTSVGDAHDTSEAAAERRRG
jgi:hypothetical protein